MYRRAWTATNDRRAISRRLANPASPVSPAAVFASDCSRCRHRRHQQRLPDIDAAEATLLEFISSITGEKLC